MIDSKPAPFAYAFQLSDKTILMGIISATQRLVGSLTHRCWSLGFQDLQLPGLRGFNYCFRMDSLSREAVIVWAGWPGTALWVPGLLLGINLMFTGWALLSISLQHKSI